MIVVADACPVIFLAKLDRLSLVQAVFPGAVVIPESVRVSVDLYQGVLRQLR
jgi:predicted nucleic acid-binding protein